MNTYRGVCARLNGEPDSQGDILTSNLHIPKNPVKVTHEFYEKTNIGDAYLEVEGNEVIAYVTLFDYELFQPKIAEQLYAVVGGSVITRENGIVKEWVLKEIAITASPADKTLTKLTLNPRNNCCKYSGPPFRHCYKCGSRETI